MSARSRRRGEAPPARSNRRKSWPSAAITRTTPRSWETLCRRSRSFSSSRRPPSSVPSDAIVYPKCRAAWISKANSLVVIKRKASSSKTTNPSSPISWAIPVSTMSRPATFRTKTNNSPGPSPSTPSPPSGRASSPDLDPVASRHQDLSQRQAAAVLEYPAPDFLRSVPRPLHLQHHDPPARATSSPPERRPASGRCSRATGSMSRSKASERCRIELRKIS